MVKRTSDDSSGPWQIAQGRLVATLLPLLLVACIQAPVRVETFHTQRADLEAIQSFAMIEPPWEHPVAGDTIRSEIVEQLKNKGLREVPAGEADMFVSFRATAVRATRRRTRHDLDTQYTVEEPYLEGTLEIDFFDPNDREVIWRGVGHVDIFSEPAVPIAAAKAVRAVLEEFPPPEPEPLT